MFSQIIARDIRRSEIESMRVRLINKFGTKIIFNSAEAKARDKNFYHPGRNEIHLKGGAGKQRRGVFYEEIQHAFDHFAGLYKPGMDNNQVHAVCARELVKNDFLPTTPEENSALLKQADIWDSQ